MVRLENPMPELSLRETYMSSAAEYTGLALLVLPASFDSSPIWITGALGAGAILYVSSRAYSLASFADQSIESQREPSNCDD